MKLYRAGGSGVALLVVSGVLFAGAWNVKSQTNSWISPGSGNWEDASWSLGAPPGPNQTVLITNSGWKAVSIRPNTASHFPQTLTVDSLIISSPTNTVNTLLMNFVGVGSPLVANSVTLNENSTITLHSSALEVSSNMSIGGIFNQNDFSGVTAATMQIGDVGPANYTMSNGTLAVTNGETIGGFNYPATFDQEGGFHLATPLQLKPGGEYDLRGGQLGGDIQIQGGILIQNGGDLAPSSFSVGAPSVDGSYTLMAGTLEAPSGISFHDGFASQFGGTNSSGSMILGSFSDVNPDFGNYTMVDGVMNLTDATINYLGDLDQQGGTVNISGALNMPTDLSGPAPGHFVWGNFTLEGGTFSAGSINLSGHITQSGGTNEVAGDLALLDSPANYSLTGGFLSTSNTLKTEGAFHQSGGVQSVQNLLLVKNPLGYSMSGGQLITPYIEIDNSAFDHFGGTINNSLVIIMDFGRWIESAPSVQLGRLRVTGSSLPSTLQFATTPSAIHFLGSSGQVWSNNVGLSIENWAGSPDGGGQTQIFFGNNSGGLSASQIAHTYFTFSQGTLPARILSSGEIVPIVNGLPFYPTDVTATPLSTNRIDLQWVDNAFNEYGYSIERSLDGTNFVQICAPQANVTSYSDTDVSAGTRYYYRIQAQSTNGNSPFSDIVSAITKFRPPLPGIVAWWRANGTAEDSIGTHDAPTPFGMSYSTGKVDQAFNFPGFGTRVRVPDSPDFVLTNAFTVEGWIYPNQTTNGIIAMRGDALPNHNSWTLHMTNNLGYLTFVIDSDTAQTVEIQAPIETNQWQHFAATFDATNGMRLYINGALAAETNTTILPVSTLNAGEEAFLGIGNASVLSNSSWFIGLVDELALYSRALTPGEVQSIYNADTAGKLALTPTIVTLGPQSAGAMQLNLNGLAGHSYEIDVCTDLVHWIPWKTQLLNSGAISITDDSVTNSPMKFYRTVPLP